MNVWKRAMGTIAAVAMVMLAVPNAVGAARAAPAADPPAMPANPAVAGTPVAPTLIWRETFENNMGTTPWALNWNGVSYTGANSETYTGLSGWLNTGVCNGLIVAGNTVTAPTNSGTVTVGGGTCGYADMLRQLAVAIGNMNGSATPSTNHVVAAFTAGNPGAGPQAQLQQLVSLPSATNRFLVMSVNSAALNCGAGAPSYLFEYTTTLSTWTAVGSAVNGCVSPAVSTGMAALGRAGATSGMVGSIYSLASFLVNSASVGARVSNQNGSGIGNDAAFDDLTIWDGTPTLDKSFSPTTISANGTSTLTLTLTNTSELAAKVGWGFTDTLPAGLKVASPPTAATTCGTGTSISAPPGLDKITVSAGNLTKGMASCTITVNVTAAADGSYANGASNINPVVGLNLPASPATLTVLTPKPKLTMAKTASPTTITAAGQTVNYTITATNAGNVPLTSVSVSDPKVTGLACVPTIPVATLAVGASISCQGSYVATQADVDAGSIANTATGSASSSGGAVSGTASATVTSTRTPGLSVTKSVSPTGFLNAGEVLSYSITARNTGNVSLTNVSVSDPKVSSLLCTPTIPVAKLAPSAQIVCTGTRTVTAGDVTAGVIVNTATATGTPPVGSAITATGSATATGLPKNPQLTVTKTASPTAMSAVGETITYTITAKNTGDILLTDVTVTDPKVTGLTCLPALPVASLVIGASIACQGTHVVTQDDLDAVTLLNTASASGSSTIGAANASAQATVNSTPAPSLAVAKTVSPTTFLLAGETLNYQIRVTNTGNVTLRNVAVSDPKVAGLSCSPSLPATSLAPGQQIVCTGSRIVTNADVIAGSVVNTATSTGTPPTGAPVSATGTATSTGVPQDPKLDVTKSALPTTFSRAGDRITYTIVAVNSGNVPLTNVSVSDPGVSSLSCTPALPVATLSAGESITCVGSRLATQNNVDAGFILNTASASGTPPLGGPVSDSASVTVPGPAPEPQLSLAKSASPVTYAAAGDRLTYTIVATNTGNVTLTSVTVSDPSVTGLTCSPTQPVASLTPGATITCSGSRVVTQAEVDGGSVTNTASTAGTGPGAQPVSASATNVVQGLPAVPRLSVVKSAAQPAFTGVDSQIDYTLTLTNIGTATLKDLVVSDSLETPSCLPSLTSLQLAPGERVVCTYSHTVTGLEATVARVDNTASASATSLSGVPTSDEATLVTPGPVPAPQLSVDKSADPAVFTEVGETVTFTIIATNTGNVPLADVTVSDPGLTLSCDQTLPVALLEVGASIRCSATKVVTQADVDAGSMSNVASASGDDLLGNPVSGADAVTVAGPTARPSLLMVKRASTTSVQAVGEVVTYSFEITNTGNVTISEMLLEDPTVSNLSCSRSSLGVGQMMTCSATHVVTQADLDGNSLVNVATISGVPARGSLPTAVASAIVDPVQLPSLVVSKSVLPVTFRTAGERLTFTVTAINTGNVTLSNVSVSDPMLPSLSCTPSASVDELEPGASVVCVGPYVVRQADVDAGSLSNTASASGDTPWGETVPASASREVPGPASEPQLSLSKVARQSSYAAPGDQLVYELVATNTGNVTLSGVTLSDPKLPDLVCSTSLPAVLAPGAAVTCSGAYTVTQSDVDGGTVSNMASASGQAPGGAPVSDAASADVTGVPPVPRITVVKTASPPAFTSEGETIVWTIVISNTGMATLTGLGVDDSMGAPVCDQPTPVDVFAPGDTVTCSYNAVVSAEDVERGTIVNIATASAADRDGAQVTGADTFVLDGPTPNPRLSVVKTASVAAFDGADEAVTFTIVATNTGNVQLENVVVTDPGLSLECDASLPVAVLEPGEAITCTASRVTTMADVDAGSLHNDASASGSTPLGQPIEGHGAIDVPGPIAAPSLSLSKSTTQNGLSSVGQVIAYVFTITNNGNVTVHDVAVTDPLLSAPAICDASTLAPGESTECRGSYTARAADLDGYDLVNSATASGSASRGVTRTEQSSVVLPYVEPELPPTGGGSGIRWALLVFALGVALTSVARRRRLWQG